MAPIKYIISTLFTLVMLLTSVAQYHHHDCAGNVFLSVAGDDNELAIGYASHRLGHCSHTDHDDHCPANHHHQGSTADCSLHLNDVVETKSEHSSVHILDSDPYTAHFSSAILSSYPLLYQALTLLSDVRSITEYNDIPNIISPRAVTRRGPPNIV